MCERESAGFVCLVLFCSHEHAGGLRRAGARDTRARERLLPCGARGMGTPLAADAEVADGRACRSARAARAARPHRAKRGAH